MKPVRMAALNDDGLPLDLSTVFVLFMMPNFIMILLTSLAAQLLFLSRRRPELKYFLGKLANFFSKGALDRIIRDIVQHLDVKQQVQLETLSTTKPNSLAQRSISQSSRTSSQLKIKRNHDPYYLLMIPFQLDLLLTVFVYKILTRDVYFETCQSYLTTYHNRSSKVVCWLKHPNNNISNLSINVSLQQYCRNQTITYLNYEHNDVICSQYVFKSINIIDTITNIFAWHQAIVFLVTKSIVFSHWYQRKIRKTMFWTNLVRNRRLLIIIFSIFLLLSLYVSLFILIIPVYFLIKEQRRIDLTRHLIYACSKFITANIINTNLYTIFQWYVIHQEKQDYSSFDEERGEKENQSGPLMIEEEKFIVESNSEKAIPRGSIKETL